MAVASSNKIAVRKNRWLHPVAQMGPMSSKSMSSLIAASQSNECRNNNTLSKSHSSLGFFNMRNRQKMNRKQRARRLAPLHTYRVPLHGAGVRVDQFNDEKETDVTQSANWFKMEDLMSMGHVASDSECDGQSAFYYDDGDAARRIVMKHFDFNSLSSLCIGSGDGSLDMVLNGYNANNQEAVPDIEHYFIILYYNIHKSSMASLQQLWLTLFQMVGDQKGTVLGENRLYILDSNHIINEHHS